MCAFNRNTVYALYRYTVLRFDFAMLAFTPLTKAQKISLSVITPTLPLTISGFRVLITRAIRSGIIASETPCRDDDPDVGVGMVNVESGAILEPHVKSRTISQDQERAACGRQRDLALVLQDRTQVGQIVFPRERKLLPIEPHGRRAEGICSQRIPQGFAGKLYVHRARQRIVDDKEGIPPPAVSARMAIDVQVFSRLTRAVVDLGSD